MSELYKRVASVTLGSKKINYPPFSIEFEQTLALGVISSTICRLYNVGKFTIQEAEQKKIGGKIIFPQIIIDAGYEFNFGTCVLGKVYNYKILDQGMDKVLELKISDETAKWRNAIINESFRMTQASTILSIVLNKVGISNTGVILGTDKLYESFIATTLRDAIDKITKDTNSEWFFKNGIITIQPITPQIKNVFLLNKNTGLLGKPEKITGGIRIRTLFLHQLNIGDIIKVQSKEFNTNFKIRRGMKVFSNFAESFCEFETKEI